MYCQILVIVTYTYSIIVKILQSMFGCIENIQILLQQILIKFTDIISITFNKLLCSYIN